MTDVALSTLGLYGRRLAPTAVDSLCSVEQGKFIEILLSADWGDDKARLLFGLSAVLLNLDLGWADACRTFLGYSMW